MVNQNVGNEEFINFLCKIDGEVTHVSVALHESKIKDPGLKAAIEKLKQVNQLGQDIYLGRNDA